MKRYYPFKLGSVSSTSKGKVLISGWVSDGPDKDRPLQLLADVDWVRGHAERLLEAADATDKHTAARLEELRKRQEDS